ncbi:MAG TPA: hypothetical protein VFV92_02280, partial [Candidatus Bathyarchaeia archaeon]|nr:hypothetical protein [Candidatus Bathyarchaeia archaeon]
KLESLGEHWNKGDFLQYRKLEVIPERERKRKYEDQIFAPMFRKTNKLLSDAPLFFNAKIPVHTSCDNCNAWLEAYAKIVGGNFAGIVEAEASEKEKLLVVVSTDAKTLREEYESRLAHLQESCSHEESRWIDVYWMLHYSGKQLVCLRCEKTLKTKQGCENLRRLTKGHAKELRSSIRKVRAGNRRRPRESSHSLDG